MYENWICHFKKLLAKSNIQTNFKNNIPHLEKIAAILAGVYYENKPINKLKSNKISNWRKYANNYGVESWITIYSLDIISMT